MLSPLRLTGRGFVRADFVDEYGDACSIQESSFATKPCIWLGVDMAGGTVPARMHLTQEQVAELLPLLQYFVATGQIGQGPYEDPKCSDAS